jgi:hypothetical protein
MYRHDRTGANASVGECRVDASAAHDKAQNGAHVRFVGVCRSPRGLTHFLPVRTGAGLNRSRLFSHSIARAADPLAGAAHRRLVAIPCEGRAANKFSAALLIGRSHQLNRISDKPGSDLAYPFHLERPSSVAGFYDQKHSERLITRAQVSFAFGATDD